MAGAGRRDETGLELRDPRSGGQPVGAQDGGDRRDVGVVDLLMSVGQEVRPDRAAAIDREPRPRRSRDRDPRLEPLGHPGADPGEALREGHPRSPAEDRLGRSRIAAEDRDLALRVDVLDVDDPGRIRLDRRGEVD